MMAFNDEPGDCENLSRFYECYKEKLLKFAVYLLKDPERAADAVQNSAENLVRYYDSVRRLPEDKILSYSMAVVRHECYAIMQENARNRHTDMEIINLMDRQDGENDYEYALCRGALRNAIDNLSPNYRLAILMKYYLNAEDAEIGAVLKQKPASVRMTLSRARTQLEKLYAKEVKVYD